MIFFDVLLGVLVQYWLSRYFGKINNPITDEKAFLIEVQRVKWVVLWYFGMVALFPFAVSSGMIIGCYISLILFDLKRIEQYAEDNPVS